MNNINNIINPFVDNINKSRSCDFETSENVIIILYDMI